MGAGRVTKRVEGVDGAFAARAQPQSCPGPSLPLFSSFSVFHKQPLAQSHSQSVEVLCVNQKKASLLDRGSLAGAGLGKQVVPLGNLEERAHLQTVSASTCPSGLCCAKPHNSGSSAHRPQPVCPLPGSPFCRAPTHPHHPVPHPGKVLSDGRFVDLP